MYRDYAIMQEAGKGAKGQQFRRMAVVNASGPVEALGDYEYNRYLATGNKQYAGGHFQWRSGWRKWNDWNGTDDPGTKGREWRLVVTLRNGVYEHDVYLYAWKHDGRWDRRTR